MQDFLFKRRGRVCVSRIMLHESNEEILRSLFSEFYPVKIDFDAYDGNFVYYGYSPQFEVLEDGVIAPEYLSIFNRQNIDGVDVTKFLKFEKR